MGACEMVDGFSVDKLRVRVPPRQTALVRAEFLFTLVRCVFQDRPTLRTAFDIGDIRVAFAIVFYRIR